MPPGYTNSKVDMAAQDTGDPIPVTKPTARNLSGSPPTLASDDRNNSQPDPNSGQATPATNCPTAHRSIDRWLNQYSRYHQNTWNKRIHFICVPLIVLSILGLLWAIPVPPQIAAWSPLFNAATAVVLFASIYYTRLAPSLAIGMLIIASISLVLLSYSEQWTGITTWQWSIPLFILAWAGQFIGHQIEGKRPAFVNDLQFLLIGPIWILADIYRRIGIGY